MCRSFFDYTSKAPSCMLVTNLCRSRINGENSMPPLRKGLILFVIGVFFTLGNFVFTCQPETFAQNIPADQKGAAPQSQNMEAFDCLAAGQKILENGDLKGATKIFDECVKKYPTSSVTRYWLGMAFFFAHDTDKAIAEFKEVVRLDPENPLGVAMLGRMYSFDASKLGLSKELLERALTIKPDMEDARFDLARVYAQQGEFEKSFKEFGFILEGETRFALYRTELAKVLISVGQKAEAKKNLERALTYDPEFEPAKKLLNELK